MSRTAREIEAEIGQRLRDFPRFLSPAQSDPALLEALWSYTLAAYVDNPLPELVKERLFARLSRHSDSRYCLVVHACALRDKGATASDILALLELEAAESDATLCDLLDRHDGPIESWPEPGSELDRALIGASIVCFTGAEQAASLRSALQRLLGSNRYAHWASLLAYIKSCHQWVEAHPQISERDDPVVREHLDDLLGDEPALGPILDGGSALVAVSRSPDDLPGVGVERLSELEARLEETDTLLSDLADNIEEVFWVVSADIFEVIFVSRSYEKIWGRSRESLKENPRSFVDVIHPDDQERFIEAAFGGPVEQSFEIEYRIVPREGTIRWIRARGMPILDASGKLRRIAGVAEDITDEHLATEALRDSEERLRLAVDQSPFPMMIHAEDDEIVLLSRTWTELTGYEPEEVPTLTEWMERAHGGGDRLSSEVIDTLHTTGRRVHWGEFHILTKRGETRIWDFSTTPLGRSPDGRRLLLTMAADVTGRYEAEQRSRRLAAIVESSDDAILGITPDGIVTSWNAGAERLFGYSAEQMLGGDVVSSPFVPPDRLSEIPAIVKSLARGEPVHGLETVRIRNDGVPIDVSLTVSLVQDEQGWNTGVSVIARDITERRRAEEEVREKNRELEALLHVTSHDLREPLRAIEQFSLMVQSRYEDRVGEDGADFLFRVVRAARRMRSLLDDILTLSRARRIVRPTVAIPADRIVDDALQRLTDRIDETGARIDVRPDLPMLRIDPTWATEAVYNLVSNALKFTRDGAVPEIEIGPYRSLERDGVEIGLAVADRGIGVASEHAERIFDLFQRTVGREVEGTGAGLAIVRAVAERHGGRAWVRPRPGGGSEFIVTFAEAEADHSK